MIQNQSPSKLDRIRVAAIIDSIKAVTNLPAKCLKKGGYADLSCLLFPNNILFEISPTKENKVKQLINDTHVVMTVKKESSMGKLFVKNKQSI